MHPCSSTPLFITTILAEMCTVGVNRTLKSQFEAFLQSTDLSSLFKLVIKRWGVCIALYVKAIMIYSLLQLKDNFDQQLTEQVLQLISASRQGITESIIQEITTGII